MSTETTNVAVKVNGDDALVQVHYEPGAGIVALSVISGPQADTGTLLAAVRADEAAVADLKARGVDFGD